MIELRSILNEIPANPNLDVVRVVVTNKQKQVLLVQEVDDVNWKLPGGKTEIGETIEHALSRELREELGIKFSSDMVLNFHKTNIPDSQNIRYIFLYQTTDIDTNFKNTEVARIDFFDINKLPLTKFDEHITTAYNFVAN